MEFNNILLILLLLILTDKVLNRILKNIEKNKSQKINNLNFYNEDEFNMLVKKYINSLGYSNLIEKEKDEMMFYNNEGVALVGYKKVDKLTDEISKDEVMNFIANMNLKSASKGYFFTNGTIPNNIKKSIENNNEKIFQINFIDGVELLSEFNKIKFSKLKIDSINVEGEF